MANRAPETNINYTGTNKKVKDKAFTGHKMSIYCDDKNLKLHKESGEVSEFKISCTIVKS